MTKMTPLRKVLFYIPLVVTACILANTWAVFFVDDYNPHVTNYLGLILFIPVIYFLFKDKSCKKPLLALGLYLVLATFYVANITTYTTGRVSIGIFGLMIPLPPMDGTALLLFIFYCILNFGSLIELQLDYKESKGKL